MRGKQIRKALQYRRAGESVKKAARRIAADPENSIGAAVHRWLVRKGCKVA